MQEKVLSLTLTGCYNWGSCASADLLGTHPCSCKEAWFQDYHPVQDLRDGSFLADGQGKAGAVVVQHVNLHNCASAQGIYKQWGLLTLESRIIKDKPEIVALLQTLLNQQK